MPACSDHHNNPAATTEILPIKALLSKDNLTIPEYQRPYKWHSQHVLRLIEDLYMQLDKRTYRLGTIVLYKGKNDTLDIVDGQQRIITLLLLLHAFKNSKKETSHSDFQTTYTNAEQLLKKATFNSSISKANIKQNYQTLCQEVKKAAFTTQIIEFLLNQCEVVVITLTNLSEAFQFFDAQNARGKDLEPHDLLKAFHLREFDGNESIKMQKVEFWENTDSAELASLFATYLYRIRGWMSHRSSRAFTKSDVDMFKGVSINSVAHYPAFKALNIIHKCSDAFNSAFPFQFEQTIINGRRFFEMVKHYQDFDFLTDKDTLTSADNITLEENTKEILETLNRYSGRHRVGDKYTRAVFNALLMAYYDKFAENELSAAIDKIFIWAYSLRLHYQRLSFASVDNYVLENNLFVTLKEAKQPKDFLHHPLKTVDQVKSTSTEDVVKHFLDMGYYNDKQTKQ